ncbi:YncE family protein [Fimbriimonas ginsengisoli]|uniref:YncE family protein n=1 Tax=Fimbriimonas ginsengisoli TaxID=1005039 RepID=UPI00046D322A|nr:hypothetical protein [Fimbriimonas ginsengisoli]
MKVPIDWPARQRALGATESAESVLVVLTTPEPGGKGFSAFGNRGADSSAHQTMAISVDKVPVGIWRLQAEFHALPEGNGATVATASAIVQVRADGALLSASGAPLGSIAVQSQIAGVVVNDQQTVTVGSQVAPEVTAFTPNGIAALSPNAVRYAIVGGGEHATLTSGLVRGVSPGDVTVTAEVDGITSGGQVISVVTPGTKITTVDIAAQGLAGMPGSNTIYAAVGGQGAQNPNSVVAIDTSTGAVTGSVSIGSAPQYPTLSADGKTLYVVVDNGASVAKIDSTTMTKTAEFSIGTDPFGQPLTAAGLAVSPVDSNVVAVSTNWIGIGIQIYRSGVRLGHVDSRSDQGATAVAFNDTGSAVFSVTGFSPSELIRDDVDSSGVTAVTTAGGNGGYPVSFEGGRLYVGNTAYNPATLQSIGQFVNAEGTFGGLAVDATLGRAWQVSRTRLIAFDIATFGRVASYPLPSDNINSTNIVRFGAKGIAFIEQGGGIGGGRIDLLNIAPGL